MNLIKGILSGIIYAIFFLIIPYIVFYITFSYYGVNIYINFYFKSIVMILGLLIVCTSIMKGLFYGKKLELISSVILFILIFLYIFLVYTFSHITIIAENFSLNIFYYSLSYIFYALLFLRFAQNLVNYFYSSKINQ